MDNTIYKVYNPIKDMTYAVVYETDAPQEVIRKSVKETNIKAGAGRYGIVFDPLNKWKFEHILLSN